MIGRRGRTRERDWTTRADTRNVIGRPRQHGEDVDQVAEEELPGLMHGVAAKRAAVEDAHVGAV